ncbi:MAG: YitT family protein, partial [Bilophila wadsworthia]
GNAVLLLWGWKALYLRFALWTLYVTVLTSVAIPVFELFQYPVIGNTILAALLAGAVGGVGFGMLFRVGASSGGTDVIVMVARKRWAWISVVSFYITRGYIFASFVVVDIERSSWAGCCCTWRR